MTCVEPTLPVPATRHRCAVARERAQIARALLADCHFCAHHCGVNRLAGERGRCHAGADPQFFSAQVEVSDELELIPTFAHWQLEHSLLTAIARRCVTLEHW